MIAFDLSSSARRATSRRIASDFEVGFANGSCSCSLPSDTRPDCGIGAKKNLVPLIVEAGALIDETHFWDSKVNLAESPVGVNSDLGCQLNQGSGGSLWRPERVEEVGDTLDRQAILPVVIKDLFLDHRIFRLLPSEPGCKAFDARSDLPRPGHPEERRNVLQTIRVGGEVDVGPDRSQHVEQSRVQRAWERGVRGRVLPQHLLDVSLLVSPVME